jgi:AcrR family transcriptional regulator
LGDFSDEHGAPSVAHGFGPDTGDANTPHPATDGAHPDGADPDGAEHDGADPDGADPDGADPDGAGASSTDSREVGTRDPAMREAMLDAAADAVLARGWDGLRLSAVAAGARVSRQTLYNTFGSKEGLARALTARTTEQYLDGVETALRAHVDLHNQLWAAVDYTLTKAAQDPLFKAFLLAENSETFLPLLTSDGEPVVAAARARIAGVLVETHPRLDRDDLAVAGESVTRLTLSHIVLPLHPAEIVAEQIARIGRGIADPR